MFNKNPVFAICITFIRFVPKTIAFGGVATGNIKAKEAANVAGNINKSGLTSILTEMPANIGRNISVVAVFEVNSVKSDIIKATLNKIKRG